MGKRINKFLFIALNKETNNEIKKKFMFYPK